MLMDVMRLIVEQALQGKNLADKLILLVKSQSAAQKRVTKRSGVQVPGDEVGEDAISEYRRSFLPFASAPF